MMSTRTLISAAVFTTQAADAPAALRAAVQAAAAPQVTELVTCGEGPPSSCNDTRTATCAAVARDERFVEYRGRVTLPVFQAGTPPYEFSGGGITYQQGRPQVAHHRGGLLHLDRAAGPGAHGWLAAGDLQPRHWRRSPEPRRRRAGRADWPGAAWRSGAAMPIASWATTASCTGSARPRRPLVRGSGLQRFNRRRPGGGPRAAASIRAGAGVAGAVGGPLRWTPAGSACTAIPGWQRRRGGRRVTSRRSGWWCCRAPAAV